MSGVSDSYISDLRKHHQLEKDVFSICLASSGGILSLGGFNENRHLEPVQWIPMKSSLSYSLEVLQLNIEGETIDLRTGRDPLIDTGTTYSFIPSAPFNKMQKFFQDFCEGSDICPPTESVESKIPHDLKDCVRCWEKPEKFVDTRSWLEEFPPIELEFTNGMKVCIPSSSYMFFTREGLYCVAFVRSTKSFLFGTTTMAGFDMIFDQANGKLGVARSVCLAENLGIPHYRNSSAYCCGTCKDAQLKGYNSELLKIVDNSNASPDDVNLVLSTANKTSGTLTDDGLFTYEATDAKNERFYGAKVVYFPVSDREWTKSARNFTSDEAIVVTESAELCAGSEGKGWNFESSATLIIRGEHTRVSLGRHCIFSNIISEVGTEVTLVASEITTAYTHTPPVTITGAFTLSGKLVLPPYSHLNLTKAFGGLRAIDPASVVQLSPFSLLSCDNSKAFGDQVVLESGSGHIISAPATSFCQISVGSTATLAILPDPESLRPFISEGSINIKGTLKPMFLRSPFRAFSLWEKKQIVWDKDSNTTLAYHLQRILTDDENSGFISELSTVVEAIHGPFVGSPKEIKFDAELSCAGLAVDDYLVGQLYFPSLDCLNKCVSRASSNDGENVLVPCSEQERQNEPWPLPTSRGNTNEAYGGYDNYLEKVYNTTLQQYYADFLEEAGMISGPVARYSTLLGLAFGSFIALAILFISYPPRIFKKMFKSICFFCSLRKAIPESSY